MPQVAALNELTRQIAVQRRQLYSAIRARNQSVAPTRTEHDVGAEFIIALHVDGHGQGVFGYSCALRKQQGHMKTIEQLTAFVGIQAVPPLVLGATHQLARLVQQRRRSEERRVGEECVRTCRYWGS